MLSVHKKIALTAALVAAIVLVAGGLYYWHKQTYSVDVLIYNGIVVTMNPNLSIEDQVILNGAVALRKDKIVAVGASKELEAQYTAAKKIDVDGDIIMPGLINGHTHAAMTLLRGIADDYQLYEWLEKHIFPLERYFAQPDFVYWGTKLGCLEMIQGGITTAVDMYFYEERAAQAFDEMGMRAIAGHTVANPEDITHAEQFIKKWSNHPLVNPGVAPHAPHTCPEPILIAAKKLCDTYNAPLLIHVAETEHEVKTIQQRHNLTPVGYLEKINLLGNNMIAAHTVKVTDQDIHLLKQYGVGVIHNPVSNMKLASGIAPITKMLEQGVPVGLGTDGAASNNALDMIAEVKIAALLQKVATKDAHSLTAYQALSLATIDGARAIHQENKIGSLEVGKYADIIVIDTTPTHTMPLYNIFSQLVYAVKACDVDTVFINGNLLMLNKQLQYSEAVPTLINQKALEYELLIKEYVEKKKSEKKKSVHHRTQRKNRLVHRKNNKRNKPTQQH